MDEDEVNLAEKRRLAKETAEREANIEILKEELRRQEEGKQRLDTERQRLEAEEAQKVATEARKIAEKKKQRQEANRQEQRPGLSCKDCGRKFCSLCYVPARRQCKKCQILLSGNFTRMQLKQWKPKDLKALLHQHGADTSWCTEKDDLIDLIFTYFGNRTTALERNPEDLRELETIQKTSEDETPRKKRKYSEETIRDAKKRINKGEKISEVAKTLGIPTSTLFNWKQSEQQKDKVQCTNATVTTETYDSMTEKVTPDNTLDQFISDIDEYLTEGNGFADTGNTNATKQKNEDDNEKRQKKEYSQEMKTQVLQQLHDGEKVATLSRHFGIHESTIRFWLKKESNSPATKRNAAQKIHRCENLVDSNIVKVSNEPSKFDGFKLAGHLVDSHIRQETCSEYSVKLENTKVSHTSLTDAVQNKPTEFINQIGIEQCNQNEKGKRTEHSQEIKIEVLRRIRNGEKVAVVSRAVGIPATTIRHWRKKEAKPTDQRNNADQIGSHFSKNQELETSHKTSEDATPRKKRKYSKETICDAKKWINKGEKISEVPKAPLGIPTSTLSTGKRPEHPQEIKVEVLRRIRNGEKVAVVSRAVGIPKPTIRQWRKKEGNATDQRKNADQNGSLFRKNQKLKREDIQRDDLKWRKWQDVMSFKDHGKGWTKRNDAGIGFRFESPRQFFEDRYGLFEIAVCKQSKVPVKSDRIVFVKDGKILTLIERYCKYGFQKSELINDKLREGYDIKARCYYTDSEEEATKQKILLLEKHDYAWNETKRDDVADDSPSGDWDGWILVMSPDKKDAEWIKRGGVNFGYRYENLQSWFRDTFGIFEIAICNNKTRNASVVLSDCGKILTCVRNYCTGNATISGRINRVLRDGYDILVRCCYVTPGTEKEARKEKTALLARYEYAWHRQRAKRENIKNVHFKEDWTEWMPIMAPVEKEGWCRRGDNNIGFRLDQIETAFEDKFGVFELKIDGNGQSEVMYVQHGKLVSLLQKYCIGDCQIAAMLNRALREKYSVLVRCHYKHSDDGKKEAAKFIRQLLKRYDYSWNKCRREDIDDANISGDWSDWVTVLTPRITHGWIQRDLKDVNKGYRRENFANLFEEKYGIFEMQIFSEDNVEEKSTTVYVGKGNILTEVKTRCCFDTKQSRHIDQALRDGKSLSIRYCYTKSDTLDEAVDLERQLLDRYDYAWIRTKREDVYDNDLSGKWSEWQKIMKPGEVEKDWTWRDEKYIGFKTKNIDGLFKDKFGSFEIAIEKPDQDVVVHLGKGKILSELKKYCKINTDGSYKSLPISDSLAKGYNILVRYMEAQSEQDAANTESQLLNRYDYPWNWTKREELEDMYLPGELWSNWEMFMFPENIPGWIRRDSSHTGYRLSDKSLADKISQNVCGVYEWRIEKPGRSRVVYAGKADSLLQRLTDYCKNGSHKSENFNTALSFGYSICVRFRYTEQPDEAENELLDRYDYAWNKVRNNMERRVFLADDIELQ